LAVGRWLGEAGRSAVGRAVGLVLKGARGAAGNFLVRTRAWGGRGRARLNLSVTNPFDINPESKKIFVSSPRHIHPSRIASSPSTLTASMTPQLSTLLM
jgi:hypothetical protein